MTAAMSSKKRRIVGLAHPCLLHARAECFAHVRNASWRACLRVHACVCVCKHASTSACIDICTPERVPLSHHRTVASCPIPSYPPSCLHADPRSLLLYTWRARGRTNAMSSRPMRMPRGIPRYRLRDRTRVRPVVPEEIGSHRRRSASSGMHHASRSSQQRMMPGARMVSTSSGRKAKLLRPNTVVSEQGKKLRVFETDASESGEDVSVCLCGEWS